MNATKLEQWLKAKLDISELRVRAGKSTLADSVGHDTYWCAGYAQGYKAAQRDARRASSHDRSAKP
jgi:hypothetical protein